MGEWGAIVFFGGEHQALAIEIAAIQTKSAYADWCLLIIGFYFLSFESLLISLIKSLIMSISSELCVTNKKFNNVNWSLKVTHLGLKVTHLGLKMNNF